MPGAKSKSTFRMIAASFATGASLVAVAGLVAPVLVDGGLSVRDAMASQVEEQRPVIEPLDVAAINAQLDAADASMQAMRAATDDELARLARLR